MATTTLLSSILIMATLISAVFSAKLSPTFYDDVCPKALKTIKNVVKNAVQNDPRMGASLLRLHFHDCFVKGCDASILLDDTNTINGEKNAFPNMNSIRGYEIIDNIKSAVDSVCGAPIISCADILAVAARDSVVALGGPTWNVQLGRRDSTSASKDAANNDLPPPFSDLSDLIKDFKKKGLSINDLVALSGAHTIGFSKCSSFRDRIYNETNIDASFARNLRASCPANGGDDNLSPFDITPEKFDVKYFKNLVQKKGLLHSDQVLYNGGVSDKLVELYSSNPIIFFNDFAKAMVKMGNIHPLTGKKGQIRVNCRRVNN